MVRLSTRAKDAITLEYTCVGLRLDVPPELLAKDYASFLISFRRRLDRLDTGYELARSVVTNVERSALSAKKSWIMGLFIRAGLMVGHELLPQRVRDKYELELLQSWWARLIQKCLCGILWLIFPFLMCIPLREMSCLLLMLKPQLRPIFHVRTSYFLCFLTRLPIYIQSSLREIHNMDILCDKSTHSKSSAQPTEVVPTYTTWLASCKNYPPLPQIILVRTLEAQLSSNPFRAWLITYPYQIIDACINATFLEADKFIKRRKVEVMESGLYYRNWEIKLPEHGSCRLLTYSHC